MTDVYIGGPYREPAPPLEEGPGWWARVRAWLAEEWRTVALFSVFVLAINAMGWLLSESLGDEDHRIRCRTYCESTGASLLDSNHDESTCTCVKDGEVMRIGPDWRVVE